MSKVLAKVTPGMSRLDWLKLRQKGIGGSDAAAIFGMSRWKSPIDIWLSKTTEISQEDEQSEAAYWGTVLEDVVAKEFEKRTGLKVRRKNAVLQHDEYEFMIADIDREIVGQIYINGEGEKIKAGLECKTASEYKKDEWKDDEIPMEYLIQCQHYMAVTGYDAWVIAVLIGGNKFFYKVIERDDEFIEMLIKTEQDFWNNHVLANVMPPVDGSDASANVLKAMYPEAEKGTEIQLSANENDLLFERAGILKMMDAYEKRIQEIENEIKATMGENENAVGLNFAVKWSNSSRTTVDSKRLKAEKPEIYEQYAKVSNSRTFKVKEIG